MSKLFIAFLFWAAGSAAYGQADSSWPTMDGTASIIYLLAARAWETNMPLVNGR